MKRTPQAAAGVGTEFEITVERDFDRVGVGYKRRALQPDAMFDATQREHRMPTVCSLPQVSTFQRAEIEVDPQR